MKPFRAIQAIAAPRYLRITRGLCIFWSFIILVLCLIPASDLPKTQSIPHIDKAVHFFMYFFLSGLAVLAIPAQQQKKRLLFILALSFTFSLIIEILQGLLPFGRSFSGFDLIANLCGILTGIVTSELLLSKSRNR